MRPGPIDLVGLEPQRPVLFGLARQGAQRLTHLVRGDAAQDADRAEMVPVKAFRQAAQHELRWVGGDAFDDELAPGDAERDLRPVGEQLLGARDHSGRGGLQRRVPARIHAELVERNRQLDQEFVELP